MPVYPYRCSVGHYTEKFFSMGKQAKEIPCECGSVSKRIYTVPQISVDNTDKVDYTVSAGRNFSNKRELEMWMRERNVHVMDDSYLAAEREEISEAAELQRSLASRGIDYAEYLQDQRESKVREQDELMRKLGVKVEQVEASDYLGASSVDGWSDTVENEYLGDTYRNSRGQEITKLSMRDERVSCPYSELTNGAVSNI